MPTCYGRGRIAFRTLATAKAYTISSKSPSLTPERNSFHSAHVYAKTGPLGSAVLPKTTNSPSRATCTHAPPSQVRETRQLIPPGADRHMHMLILPLLFCIEGTTLADQYLASVGFSYFVDSQHRIFRPQGRIPEQFNSLSIALNVRWALTVLIASKAFDEDYGC
jgi:hypothetical protein